MANPKIDDATITEAYLRLQSVWKAGEEIGISGQSVHERVVKLGIVNKIEMSKSKAAAIRKLYEAGFSGGDGQLNALCVKLGMEKGNISSYARKLGLSNAKRKLSDSSRHKMSKAQKGWLKKNEHPRGSLGLKHSKQTLAKMSRASKASAAKLTPEERSNIALKGMQTKMDVYGTLKFNHRGTTWKQGWRIIGGIRKYYRSRWEANYARYLEWLKHHGEIKHWEHEPETFWFEGIMRGCRSYLPDFKVTENNGDIKFHEVKGWMDTRSKTKIRRMAKYHPEITLIVINAKAYRALEKQASLFVEGWESKTSQIPV